MQCLRYASVKVVKYVMGLHSSIARIVADRLAHGSPRFNGPHLTIIADGVQATTTQWLYASLFGASQSSETSEVASSVPVVNVETSKMLFAERNTIGEDVKGSPGGTAWTLTSKDLLKEAPGGVAWQANPEEVLVPSVKTDKAAPRTAAQKMQDTLNGTASHALTFFEVCHSHVHLSIFIWM